MASPNTRKRTISEFLLIKELEPKALSSLQFTHHIDYKRKVVFVTKSGRRISYDKTKGILYDGDKYKLPVGERGRPPTVPGGKVKVSVWISSESHQCLQALAEIQAQFPKADRKSHGDFIDEGLRAFHPEYFKE